MADTDFRTGEEMPHGAATQVGALEGAVPDFLDPLDDVDVEPEEGGEDLLFEDFEDDEEFTPDDEDRAFLYESSERRDEPVTAGAPIGDGAPILSLPTEDAEAFRMRIADALEASPGATPQVKGLVERLRLGL